MKSSGIFLASVVAVRPVVAEDSPMSARLGSYPECAILCLGEVVPKTGCPLTNQTCLCTDQAFRDTMSGCVMASCTIKEALLTRNLSAIACNEPIRDRSSPYAAVATSLITISAVVVSMRFGYKYWANSDLWFDDWLTLLTLFTNISGTILMIRGMLANGMGRDIWTLPIGNIATISKFSYFLAIIYFAEIAFIKLAILFFYLRIFPTSGTRLFLSISIVLVSLYLIAFIIVGIFMCKPISYFWWKWDGEHQGTCVNRDAIICANGAISVALDLWILAIPLWKLKSLRLNWKKKAAVAVMFCVGTFVTIISMIRLRAVIKLRTESHNPTWDFLDIGIWSTLEVNAGIFCVCMPSLRLLLLKSFPYLLTTTTRYYSKCSSGLHHLTARKQTRTSGQGSEISGTVCKSWTHGCEKVNANGDTHITAYKAEHRDEDNDEIQLVNMETYLVMIPRPANSYHISPDLSRYGTHF